MRVTATTLLAIACVVPNVLSEIVITVPTGSTTCTGGQQCSVNWAAGPNAPTLEQCGACSFSLDAGSSQQQTNLQVINSAVPVATTGGIVFTVDPTIGPNYSGYFIRVQCPITDPTNPAIPYLAFSHMFTLAGMSGTFNATVQAQISATAAAAGGSTSSTTTASTGSTTTKSTSSTKTSTSPSATHTNAAMSIHSSSGVLFALTALVGMLL